MVTREISGNNGLDLSFAGDPKAARKHLYADFGDGSANNRSRRLRPRSSWLAEIAARTHRCKHANSWTPCARIPLGCEGWTGQSRSHNRRREFGRTPKTDGFTVWSEDDIAAYETRWPVGTRQRVWLDVLIYTGLRRGAAVRLGRQHVRNGIATVKTEKSGYRVEVSLPILPVLAKTLEAGPCGDLTFTRW